MRKRKKKSKKRSKKKRTKREESKRTVRQQGPGTMSVHGLCNYIPHIPPFAHLKF